MLTLACLAACALATKVIEIPSPEGITFPLDRHPETVERIVYTDEKSKGFTMRLREQRKPYLAENDKRRTPLKAS